MVSEGAKRYVEVTETMKHNLDDVSQSLREINKYNSGLAKGFTELTKASKPFGRAWLMLGRLSSGTSFWRFQNRVKSISDLLQFQELLLKKRLEKEDELTDKLGKYEGHLKIVKKTEEGLIKLQKGKLDFTNAESTLKSKYYKVLKAEFGTTTALDILKQRAVKAQKKALKFEEDMSKPRIQAFKDERKRANILKSQIDYYHEIETKGKANTKDIERRKKLEEEIQPLLKSKFLGEEDMLKMSEKQLKLTLELNDMVQERAALRKAELLEISKLEEDAQEAREAGNYLEFRSIEKERIERLDAINDIMQAREDAIADQQDLLEGEGISTKIDYRKSQRGEQVSVDTSGMKQKTRMEKLQEYLKDSTAYKVWEKGQAIKEWSIKRRAELKEKGFKKYFTGGFKKILTATGKFLFFALQATLLFGLLIFFLMGLHKAGILDLIVYYLITAWAFMGKIIELAIPVVEALFQFISDIFAFMSALFEGDSSKIMETGKTLLISLGKLLYKIGEFLFWVAFEALDGLTGGWFTKAKEKFEDWFGEGKGAVFALGVLIVGTLFVLYGLWLVAAWLIAQSTRSPFVMLIALIAAVIAGLAFWLDEDGKYTGGVSTGRMSLVGEKGPELVKLPAGSRIHNNAESRRMGMGTTNNITVNVQGRVGASDAELRDVANKVSRMISTQINRTTSSGTRI